MVLVGRSSVKAAGLSRAASWSYFQPALPPAAALLPSHSDGLPRRRPPWLAAGLAALAVAGALLLLGGNIVALLGARGGAPRYEALRMGHIRGARALAADASDECAPSCAHGQFGKLCSRVLATMHQCDWGVTDDAPLRAYWELSDEVCLGRTVPDARTAFQLQEEVSAIDAGCSDTWWRLAAFKLGASCTSEPAQLVRRGVEVCEAEARAAIWWSPRDWWQRNQRAKRLALLQQLADTLSRHGDRNVRQAVEAVADSRDACVSANGDRLQHPACVQCSQAFANMTAAGSVLCRLSTVPGRVVGDGSDHADGAAVLLEDVAVNAQQHTMLAVDGTNASLRAAWDVPIVDILADEVQAALALPPPSEEAIPPKVHFVYGLAFGAPPPFGLIEYVAMRSALEVHGPGAIVYLHCTRLPADSYWWREAQKFVRVERYLMPTEVGSGQQCLSHHAHRADWLRLLALHKHGGIYLDMDVLSVKPFPKEVLAGEMVMGWQDSNKDTSTRRSKAFYGLCNAAMLAKPGARFISLWMRSYDHFRSSGRDWSWDEHSVILPANITDRYPELIVRGAITVLNASHMFVPLWNEVEHYLFRAKRAPNATVGRLDNLPHAYTVHLWRSADNSPYGRMLQNLEHEELWWTQSYFGIFASKYLKKALVIEGQGQGGAEVTIAKSEIEGEGAITSPRVLSLYAAKPLDAAYVTASHAGNF